MRVGVIGPDHPDSSADNVASTLEAMGLPTLRLGPARPGLRSAAGRALSEVAFGASLTLDDAVQRRIIRRAREFECDLVISVDARLLPGSVARMRARGTRVALWFPDHVANLGRQLMLASPYDAVYFKDAELVARLDALLDVPVRYLPQACNPMWHRPPAGTEPQPHVAVVGNMYPSRVALLDRLLRDGVPLALYGAAFPRWLRAASAARLGVAPPVVRAAKATVFRRAAAVLNNLHPAEMAGVNLRTFEATASGAVVLCEDRPTLDELFAPDSEILIFRKYDELLGLIRGVLAAPTQARPIGDAASRRAHAEHTYQHRLGVILQDLA